MVCDNNLWEEDRVCKFPKVNGEIKVLLTNGGYISKSQKQCYYFTDETMNL